MGPFLCVRLLEFHRSIQYKASELELIQDNVAVFIFFFLYWNHLKFKKTVGETASFTF